jgi:hypothetical protein
VIIWPDGNFSKHWKKVPQAEMHPANVLKFWEKA